MNAHHDTGAIQLLAEAIPMLKAGLEAVPPGGRKRQRGKEQRSDAYVRFQNAAQRALTWPEWLTLTEQATRSRELTLAQAWPDLVRSRDAVSELLGALGEIRIFGNPEPRRLAEEIVALLVELMEARLPGRPPDGLRLKVLTKVHAKTDKATRDAIARKVPGASDRMELAQTWVDPEIRQAAEERFRECQRALGLWHKKFDLACRDDLGYGPRWWQFRSRPRTRRWQFWRKPELWPGGWPPAEAAKLLEAARQEWASKDLSQEQCAAHGPATQYRHCLSIPDFACHTYGVTTSILDREMYTEAAAAKLLRVAASTLHWWLEGRMPRYRPVIRTEPTGSHTVTWAEFVEASLLRSYRRDHDVPLRELREFIDKLRDEFGVPYPLADRRPYVGPGRRLLIDLQDSSNLDPNFCLVAVVSGQAVLTAPGEDFFKRVEWVDDEPRTLRPHDDQDSPVRINPLMRFGRPAVSGISTEAIAGELDDGASIEEVAEDFNLTPGEVRWAQSYELSQQAA